MGAQMGAQIGRTEKQAIWAPPCLGPIPPLAEGCQAVLPFGHPHSGTLSGTPCRQKKTPFRGSIVCRSASVGLVRGLFPRLFGMSPDWPTRTETAHR